jgi:ligand-binding SRPBCC domain-containing protein
MMHRVQFEQWVPEEIERVFLFFANPANLPRIMPPETGIELTKMKLVPPSTPSIERSGIDQTCLAGVGSEIVTSFRMISFLPLRARWIALVTEFEWNHHFADVQKKGPFKSFHHRHQLHAEKREGVTGTVVRDAIEYEVGFGWLGGLAGKFFIGRQLQRTFAYRQQALLKLLS